MSQQRRTTTVRQLELLVEFMSQHKDLALGRVRGREYKATANRLLENLTGILNPEGAQRNAKEWMRVWVDLKCRVRTKLINNKTSIHRTGGGPNQLVVLTPIEEEVANIIGRDVGAMPGANVTGQVEEEPLALTVGIQQVVCEEEEDQNGPNASQHPSTIAVLVDHDHIYEGLTVGSELTVANDHTLSTNGTGTPPQPPLNRAALRRRQRALRPRPRQSENTPPAPPADQSALTEVHSTLARIELLKSETEQEVAKAAVLQAQNMGKFADALQLMAGAMTSIANTLKDLVEQLRPRANN